MNTAEILKTHNAWRRGDDTRTQDELGFSATELGLAIDDAVRAISERDQLRAELEECIRAWALTTSEIAQERGRANQLAEHVERLREALETITSEAERCDSWEYFPSAPIELARLALDELRTAAPQPVEGE